MKKRRNSSRVISHSLLLLFASLFIGSSSLADAPMLPPLDVVCPAATGKVVKTKRLQRISGSLELGDPTLNFLDYSCFSSYLQVAEGEHEFDVVNFTPSVSGIYTFFMGADFAGNFSLSQGSFNVDNPCSHLMQSAERSYLLPLPGVLPLPEEHLSFDLRANETYSLLISNELVGEAGSWEVTAYHETAGTLSGFDAPVLHPLLFDLLLTDTSEVLFSSPQQWIVDEAGNLDTAATLAAFFAGDEAQLNAFLAQLNYTGLPAVSGDCGPMVVRLNDELSQGMTCEGLTITRTFEVQTIDENCTPATTSCQQLISFRSPTLADVQWPAYSASVQCDENFPVDGEVGGPDDNPSVAAVGRPLLLTAAGYVELDSSYLNLGASYVDEPRIVVCDGIYKYRRQWSLEDECAPEGSLMIPQLVTVDDEVGPVFFNLMDTIRISSSPFSCFAHFAVPVPEVTDGNGCSSAVLTTYAVLAFGEFFFAGGDLDDSDVVQLPLGEHIVVSCTEDACGNETCGETVLIITDSTSPTANCNSNLSILIGGGDTANGLEGIARVFPEDVNNGSNDNCGEVTFELRRNYWRNNTCDLSANRWSPWGPHVDFYCCDIDNDNVTIELRVTDGGGQQSTCWTIAEIDDMLAPYCYAPAAASITCGQSPVGFPADIEGAYVNDFGATSVLMNSLFGGATGTDNCSVDTLVENQPLFQFNDCGWGTITRRFEAWQLLPEGDANGNGAIDITEVLRSTNSCTQVITVAEAHDFVIDFPQDVIVDCSETDFPGVVTTSTGCDVLSINIGDPVPSTFSGEECNQVSITYDVINWCVWDGASEGWEIPRLTEDDGELFGTGFGVEAAERPVLRITSATGPDDENCDGILSTAENGVDDATNIRYFLLLDRNHPDVDGDSSLPDVQYDNVAETPEACLPADENGLRNYGRFRYTQFVKVLNVESIEINVLAFGGPTANCPDLLPGQFGDDDGDCEEAVAIPFSVASGCGLFADELNTSVSIVSAQLDAFAVDANGDNIIQADEFVVETGEAGNVIANIVTNSDGTYTLEGAYPIIPSAMGDSIYHAVSIVVEDGCGNQSNEMITFDVIDCKGPVPVCINGKLINLSPQPEGGCALEVMAIDFQGSPIYDCTGQGPGVHPSSGQPLITKYAIYFTSEVNDPTFVPSPADTSLWVTDENYEETMPVTIFTFDEEGNYGSCDTYILVQFSHECFLQLGGIIKTKEDEAIEGVEVTLSGSANGSDETDAVGNYYFGGLDFGGGFSLVPYLNTDHGNGVNTIDMIKILKHINGTELLQSPYQLIAADVDGSGDITMADFDYIRQLLLGIIQVFPNNTSWRFVLADYVFPNPSNPWESAFPEIITLGDVQEDVLDIDFVGVKIGDLNCTAMSNFQSPPESYLRETVNLWVEDIEMGIGEEYTIPVMVKDLAQFAGLQGTFHWQDLEVVDIHYGLEPFFGRDHLGTRYLAEGYLTMAWFKPAEMRGKEVAGTTTTLFSLVVRAKRKAKLSELLSFNNRYTAAEAYRIPLGQGDSLPDGGEEVYNLGLIFSDRDVTAQGLFELYQNKPNPFAAATLIGFNLPDDAAATVTINDASGRVLRVIKGDYAAGYNTINVTKQDLQGATGVLSYTIEAGEHRATRQMIVVD
jgi:hypothetical protein